jgi:Tub family
VPVGRSWECSIYLNQRCVGTPCARLKTNLLGTRYELLPAGMKPFQAAAAAGDGSGAAGARQRSDMPKILAVVHYKTRIKGFMRPRRCPSTCHACPTFPSKPSFVRVRETVCPPTRPSVCCLSACLPF